MVKIEKDVPFPTLRQEYRSYPFDQMEIGDSFFVSDMDGNTAHRLQTQVSYQKRREDDGKRFTTRRQDGGIRVWRIQ